MVSKSTKASDERIFGPAGLIFCHAALFAYVMSLDGRFWALIHFDSICSWLLLALNLVCLRFFFWTIEGRQRASIEHYLQEDQRFPREKQFCMTCNLMKPLRTKHCRKCGVCCERFDHHCTLMGVCIGRHNHRNFYLMLLFDVLLLSTSLSMIFHTWWNEGGFSILFCAIIALVGLIPTGLFFFHTWLVFSNLTTWEFMRHDAIYYLEELDEEVLPFDHGCSFNFVEFFFKMHASRYMYSVPDLVYSAEYQPPANCCNNKYYSCC